MVIPDREAKKQCYWLWGAPGLGKTKEVHEHKDLYQKLANKWWDGYTGQETVLIDDLGIDKAKALTDHLKLWMDPWYNQPGETKGGQVALTYTRLYVTSNYSPEQIWDKVDLDALKRRMVVTHF